MSENDKKNMIYKSGLKLFSNKGPKKVSIDMIINDANVGKGTFYKYFENKESLYEQIIEGIMDDGSKMMIYLQENIPDIKERFLQHMLGMLKFFENHKILKMIIDGDTDYYFGKINRDFLYTKHIELMKILLGNDFKSDIQFLNIVSNVKGFYIEVLNKKNYFCTISDYEEFTLKLAAILINGLFSDYDSLINGRTFSDFTGKCKKYTII